MAIKFLDYTGLQKFWTKCKNVFVAKDSSGNVTINGQANFNGEVHIQGSEGLLVDNDAEVAGNLIVRDSAVAITNEDDGATCELKCNSDGKLLVNNGVVATVTDVTTAVANAGHLKREKVTELPGVATAKENVIYMVSNSTTGNNKFDEYMFIDGAFEKTGSSDIDLSGYPTTEQMNTAISNAHTAITEAEINGLT